MTRKREIVQVETLNDSVECSEMVRDVRAGLLGVPKDLSPWPKYFYDERGSELFEEITALPEYYQGRAELSILCEAADELVSRARPRKLIELGSGSASKTRALLDAMQKTGGTVRYVPLDVSEGALRESTKRLPEEYPGLEISGFVGDFDHSLARILGSPGDGGRLVIFLGGTFGNFTPRRRRSFLDEVRSGLREGDHLLLGVDLVKNARTLEAAYDDVAGVTARFNKNLLEVLNERLGGKFDPDLFVHRAVYNARERRIEMWLFSEVEQTVEIAGLGLEASFGAGEGMRTEVSYKFTREGVDRTFDESGLALLDWRTDKLGLYGLALGGPRKVK
ncbi:MAG: L-histidine N(alpha)-methyltransferase [Actinobacteria bacterium]|nr:L-histidine N(alpha)-methyltransferase [Actinomycetota bacterium]